MAVGKNIAREFNISPSIFPNNEANVLLQTFKENKQEARKIVEFSKTWDGDICVKITTDNINDCSTLTS